MTGIRSGLFQFEQALTRGQKKLILWLLDIILAPLSFLVVVATVYYADDLWAHIKESLDLFIGAAILSGSLSLFMRMPWIKLKSYEAYPFRLLPFSIVMSLSFASLTVLVPLDIPAVGLITFWLLFLCASFGVRLACLQILLWVLRARQTQIRILIYGAGSTGLQLASALKMHEAFTVVGFVDDDENLIHLRIAGIKIYSSSEIKSLVRNENISRIILAMPSVSRPRQAQLARDLLALSVEVQIVPSFAELVGAEVTVDRLTLLTSEQFLGRNQLSDSLSGHNQFYRNKSVMVTGAGGSIGSEICRQLLRDRPKRLVMFELSEQALYKIDQELMPIAQENGIELVAILGSVSDARSVDLTLNKYKVEVVLHAAAYKHVPLVEANPLAGVSNNVMGTRILTDVCVRNGVGHFLLISTDKAVRPTNVMGATKRVAEMVVQSLAERHPEMQFAIVRFGNVLGSSGSVIPLFKEQIAQGGPVTLTHNEVRRYFMTVTEAASLVLLAGGLDEVPQKDWHGRALRSGADVFVLDMGEPIRIRDLAERLIREAGYTVRDEKNPNGDIEIKIIGLRPGEKLYEELLIGEHMANTPHPKIKRAAEAMPLDVSIPQVLHELGGMISVADVDGIRGLLFELAWAAPMTSQERGRTKVPRSVAL